MKNIDTKFDIIFDNNYQIPCPDGDVEPECRVTFSPNLLNT